jgi:hypothetical protein
MTENHLDRNIKELLTGTEPCVRLPAQRKAEILKKLLTSTEKPEKKNKAVMWHQLGIAALVILTIAIGFQFIGTTSVALADILENLQQRAYTFNSYWQQGDEELKLAGQGMVLQPGLIRFDMPQETHQGLAIVTDAINHKTRWVTSTGKDLGEVQLPLELQDDPNLYQSSQNFLLAPVESLWGLTDGSEEPLGVTEKEGTRVIGYRVERTIEVMGQTGLSIYTVWARADTGLPYEIAVETIDPNGANEGHVSVLRDFDFDVHIDKTLFGLGANQEGTDVNDGRFVVQPGVGMGNLMLGAEQGRIIECLGDPDFKMGDAMYQYSGLAVLVRDGKVYAIFCGDLNGSDTPHVKKCQYRTTEGIAMGSLEEDVVAVYGEPTRRRDESGSIVLFYREKNMTFMLTDDKVHFMDFKKPRPPKDDSVE